MPIQIKDYTWEESESMLFITVPLKGANPGKVDIFTTESYIKVHYPPYFFDAWLYDSINDEDSKAEVGNGAIVFKLHKSKPVVWGHLMHPEANEKSKLRSAREAAIVWHQQRLEQQKKLHAEQTRQNDKFAINQQIQLENTDKQRIETVKTTECEMAISELTSWKEEQRRKALQEHDELLQSLSEPVNPSLPHESPNKLRDDTVTKNQSAYGRRKGKKPSIFECEAGDQPLRETGKISVSFTHRDFPTAARESTAPLEEEWLRKQLEASKLQELADSDLSEHERDPVWLRDKGNDFFKSGNYQAAINVFTHAIRVSRNMPALYSNRAACHLMLKNHMSCVEDTSKALELLTPPVPQNAASRCRAHIRRGTALCQLELYVEGLADYEMALKLDPNNESVRADAERMRQIIQGSTPT